MRQLIRHAHVCDDFVATLCAPTHPVLRKQHVQHFQFVVQERTTSCRIVHRAQARHCAGEPERRTKFTALKATLSACGTTNDKRVAHTRAFTSCHSSHSIPQKNAPAKVRHARLIRKDGPSHCGGADAGFEKGGADSKICMVRGPSSSDHEQ